MNIKYFISFFILLLGIKFINNSLGCIGVGSFILLVGGIIFLQLMDLKKELEKVVCNVYFKKESILRRICLSRIFYGIFALFFSFVLSFSLLSFMYLSDIFSLIFVFIDGIVIYFLYNLFQKSVTNHLQDNLHRIFAEFATNFLNIIIFILVVVITSYYTRENITPDLNVIADYVHEHIYHSCQYYKWYLRTAALLKYAIDSILSMEFINYQIRIYLYFFFVITSVSLLPALALSFYYKWFLHRFSIQKKED